MNTGVNSMRNLCVCANMQCLLLKSVLVSIEFSGNAEFSITAVPGEANRLSMGSPAMHMAWGSARRCQREVGQGLGLHEIQQLFEIDFKCLTGWLILASCIHAYIQCFSELASRRLQG